MILFDTNSQVWKYILQLPTSVLEAYFKHFGGYYRNKTHSSVYLFIFLKYNKTSAQWRNAFIQACVSLITLKWFGFVSFLKLDSMSGLAI